MDHSISASARVECPRCGKSFAANHWLIVDTARRPDLERQIIDGSIGRATCPRCRRRSVRLDRPLLVFRRGKTPTLVFYAPEGTGPDEVRRVSSDYLRRLRSRLGRRWRDEWLAAGLVIAPWDNLAKVVGAEEPPDPTDPDPDDYVPPGLRDTYRAAMYALKSYDQEETSEMIEAAVRGLEAVIHHPDFPRVGRALWIALIGELGEVYYTRYLRSRKPDDLERAIGRLREALDAAPAGFEGRPTFSLNLGLAYGARYERDEDAAVFDRSIAAFDDALGEIGACPEIHHLVLLGRGDLRKLRFQKTRDGTLLDAAIDDYREAEGLAIPGARDRVRVANALGGSHLDRIKWSGDHRDLIRAIEAETLAIDRVPPGTDGLIEAYNNRGAARLLLFGMMGDLGRLDAAVSDLERAAGPDVDGPEESCQLLMDLGNTYKARYEATRRWDDMERAMEAWQASLRRARPPDDDVSMILHSLAEGLGRRFDRTGNTEDLEASVRLMKRAVEVMPPLSGDRSLYHIGLGRSYLALYQRFDRPEYLKAAIDNLEWPLAHAMEGTGVRCDWWRALGSRIDRSEPIVMQVGLPINGLGDLGTALMLRGRADSSRADLERAVGLLDQAAVAMPPGAPDRPRVISSLATALGELYDRGGDLADLERAIRELEEAVDGPRAAVAGVEQRREVLAGLWRRRHERTGDPADAARAVALYRQAVREGREGSSPSLLTAGARWGDWAFGRGDWAEAVEGYGWAIEGIDRVIRAQGSRPGQESWLRPVQGLTARAAYALARLGRADEAAVALEKGLAVILVDALGRAPTRLEDLEARGHGDLAEAYRETSAHLDGLARSVATGEQAATAGPGLAESLRRGRERLDGIIGAIRRVEGFEGFLLPPTLREIREALAADRPSCLAYLAVTTAGSVALIVTADAVEAIPLDLALGELEDFLVRTDGGAVVGGYVPGQLGAEDFLTDALRRAPALIGGRVLRPLAARLRDLGRVDVALVPSGWLALLPLGAIAHDEGGAGTCLLDEFAVRYAPSARVLAAARREAGRRGGRLALVGVGNPLPGARPLPAAEGEIAAVAGHFPEGSRHTFVGGEATLENVLPRLESAGHLHFACHGRFRPSSPLDSALALGDPDRIRLRDVIDGAARPARARLAVLSACESAVTDFRHLPDEFIGLPSGFLQAGVPGVVGTLWSVDDPSTALLMEVFYDLYLPEAATTEAPPPAPAEALGRAQLMLRDLTAGALRDRIDRERRRPRQHRRLPDRMLFDLWQRCSDAPADDRPFAEPIYWMPFTFHGA